MTSDFFFAKKIHVTVALVSCSMILRTSVVALVVVKQFLCLTLTLDFYFNVRLGIVVRSLSFFVLEIITTHRKREIKK